MLKKITVLIFLIIFSINQTSLAAEINIRYLDLNFIINNSEAGKDIIAKFKKKKDSNIKEFIKIEKDLNKEKKNLLSQKNILKNDEFQKKISLLQEKINNYQINRSKKEKDLDNERIFLIKKLLKYIDPILLDYSAKNSIDLIMKKESFLSAKTELNITKEILNELNKIITKIKN